MGSYQGLLPWREKALRLSWSPWPVLNAFEALGKSVGVVLRFPCQYHQTTYEVGGLPGGENITVSERKILECLPCTSTTRSLYLYQGWCLRAQCGLLGPFGRCPPAAGHLWTNQTITIIHSFSSRYLEGKVYRSSARHQRRCPRGLSAGCIWSRLMLILGR